MFAEGEGDERAEMVPSKERAETLAFEVFGTEE